LSRDPYVDGPLLARGGTVFLIEAIAAICPVC
jgi:hypothetical protein